VEPTLAVQDRLGADAFAQVIAFKLLAALFFR
jgi:hypothetical protein